MGPELLVQIDAYELHVLGQRVPRLRSRVQSIGEAAEITEGHLLRGVDDRGSLMLPIGDGAPDARAHTHQQQQPPGKVGSQLSGRRHPALGLDLVVVCEAFVFESAAAPKPRRLAAPG